ncbi:nitric oxide dioxygenase [Candida albicans P57072]|nr:nitric oxide dioxygenase [Candida albicans P57072]KHC27545.1 nitric oxide dioxygenase [Candida albicans P76055]KHC27732.1 nitric oxide dioxygenase [Candida albicans P76067]
MPIDINTKAKCYFDTRPLTKGERKIIKDSIPILEYLDIQFGEKFFKRLIKQFPQYKPYFNETHLKLLRQPRSFHHCLLEFARNIDDLRPMKDFIMRIASKHVARQVSPDQYRVFGQVLVEVMMDQFPKEFVDQEFVEAWTMAFRILANILINIEVREYQDKPWYGFKAFRVTRLQPECVGTKSFFITSVDGTPVPIPKRGQYLCMRWKFPGEKQERLREYTISEFPKNNEYRITVRYIPGGKVTTYIHEKLAVGDIVQVSPPCGDCYYRSSKRNMVMLAGGNGVVALAPMIEKGLAEGRKVKFLYSNRSTETRSFGQFFRDLKQKYGDQLEVVEYLSRRRVIDPIDKYYRRSLTVEDLDFIVPEDDVYLIGPRTYMKMIEDYLKGRGVNVTLDYFGPQEV